MEFTQIVRQKDLQELIAFIKEEKKQGLETNYILNNSENFYFGRENGNIAVCGGYVKTLFPRAKEIRGVVTRPKNAFRTKQMNKFLCELARQQGNIAAYAVIDPEKDGMKKYIEFLETANEFREIRVPSITMVIPRYQLANLKTYEHKVLLQKKLLKNA